MDEYPVMGEKEECAPWHFWHKWSKWGEVEKRQMILIKTGQNAGWEEFQRRHCLICDAVQERIV